MCSEWLLPDYHFSTTHLSGFSIRLLNCKDVNIWLKPQINACQEHRRVDVSKLLRHDFSDVFDQALLTHGPASVRGVARAEANHKQSTEDVGEPDVGQKLCVWRREREREEGTFFERCGFSEEVLVLLCWRSKKVTWINQLALWNCSLKPLFSYIYISIYPQNDRCSFLNLHHCVDCLIKCCYSSNSPDSTFPGTVIEVINLNLCVGEPGKITISYVNCTTKRIRISWVNNKNKSGSFTVKWYLMAAKWVGKPRL